MNESYDISVIIATYNSEKYKTLRTIDSVLRQDGVNIQVIIADDGSADNHFSEICQYCTERGYADVQMVGDGRNRGTVRNVSIALGYVEAKYVKIISPGDYLYDQNVLKKMLQILKENNASACFGKLLCYSEENGEISIYNVQHPVLMAPYRCTGLVNDKLTKKYQIQYWDSVWGASIAYNTEVFRKCIDLLIGRVKYCEDYSVRIMLVDGEAIGFLNEYVVWYEYGTGISTSANESYNRLIEADKQELTKILLEIAPHDSTVRSLVKDEYLKRLKYPILVRNIMRTVRDPLRLKIRIERLLAKRFLRLTGYDLSLFPYSIAGNK